MATWYSSGWNVWKLLASISVTSTGCAEQAAGDGEAAEAGADDDDVRRRLGRRAGATRVTPPQ